MGNNGVIVIKENQMLHVFTETAPTLSEAQKLVGGLVEMVRSPTDPEIQILVNEEGLLRGLPFNEEASRLCDTGIVGDAIILKGEAKWT